MSVELGLPVPGERVNPFHDRPCVAFYRVGAREGSCGVGGCWVVWAGVGARRGHGSVCPSGAVVRGAWSNWPRSKKGGVLVTALRGGQTVAVEWVTGGV